MGLCTGSVWFDLGYVRLRYILGSVLNNWKLTVGKQIWVRSGDKVVWKESMCFPSISSVLVQSAPSHYQVFSSSPILLSHSWFWIKVKNSRLGCNEVSRKASASFLF